MTTFTPVDYEAQIADTAFPQINVAEITPSISDVALLERTRTFGGGGADQGTFTNTTTPKVSEVNDLLRQAIPLVIDQLDADLPTYLYPRVRQAVALQTALLIETSFFREQSNQGAVSAYTAMLMSMMGFLREAGGQSGGSSQNVGSVMVRSTMTDYDEYYALPAPREVIEWLKSASS